MRYRTALTASAVTVLMLSSCGLSSSSQPTNPPPPSSSDAVIGTVTWPDGNAAANASVYFYNYEPGFTADGWSNGEYQVQQLPADGSYSLTGCPCAKLTAYLYVPSTPGADPANGGQDCWIIMQDGNGTYSGRQANPGDVINWQRSTCPAPLAGTPQTSQPCNLRP
jgi:hypothetical protein